MRNPLDVAVTEYSKLKSNHRGHFTNPSRFARNGGWIPESHLAKFRFITGRDSDFSEFFAYFYDAVYHNWVLLGHDQMDLVMRYENLEEDFKTALGRIGLSPVRPIPRWNRTTDRQKDFRPYYNQNIHDQAAQVFGPFMKKWGYDFPEEWGNMAVPISYRARFSYLEFLVNLASRVVGLSPYNPVVRKVKSAVHELRWQYPDAPDFDSFTIRPVAG